MDILSFDILPSTQKYLIAEIQNNSIAVPIAVISKEQNAGIGSRDNEWSGGEGNFFASIALNISSLPDDLPISSASIYFSFIMKKVLVDLGEDIWLKWPNDFYKTNEKIGGTITKKIKDTLVCGIGINLKKNKNGYRALQSDICPHYLLQMYLIALEKFPTWKQIFSEYEIEFDLSRKFSVHIENYQESLEMATLCSDGSLIIGKRKVYSLR